MRLHVKAVSALVAMSMMLTSLPAHADADGTNFLTIARLTPLTGPQMGTYAFNCLLVSAATSTPPTFSATDKSLSDNLWIALLFPDLSKTSKFSDVLKTAPTPTGFSAVYQQIVADTNALTAARNKPITNGLLSNVTVAKSSTSGSYLLSNLPTPAPACLDGVSLADQATEAAYAPIGNRFTTFIQEIEAQILLNNAAQYAPGLAELLNAKKYDDAFNFAAAHGLMKFIELPTGFYTMNITPFTAADMTAFYAAAANHWSITTLGPEPYSYLEWSKASDLPGAAVTNEAAQGDNTYPDLSRYAGFRPSGGILEKWIAPIFMTVVTSLVTAGIGSELGAAIGPAIGATGAVATTGVNIVSSALASTIVGAATGKDPLKSLVSGLEGASLGVGLSPVAGGISDGLQDVDLPTNVSNYLGSLTTGVAKNIILNGGTLNQAFVGAATSASLGVLNNTIKGGPTPTITGVDPSSAQIALDESLSTNAQVSVDYTNQLNQPIAAFDPNSVTAPSIPNSTPAAAATPASVVSSNSSLAANSAYNGYVPTNVDTSATVFNPVGLSIAGYTAALAAEGEQGSSVNETGESGNGGEVAEVEASEGNVLASLGKSSTADLISQFLARSCGTGTGTGCIALANIQGLITGNFGDLDAQALADLINGTNKISGEALEAQEEIAANFNADLETSEGLAANYGEAGTVARTPAAIAAEDLEAAAGREVGIVAEAGTAAVGETASVSLGSLSAGLADVGVGALVAKVTWDVVTPIGTAISDKLTTYGAYNDGVDKVFDGANYVIGHTVDGAETVSGYLTNDGRLLDPVFAALTPSVQSGASAVGTALNAVNPTNDSNIIYSSLCTSGCQTVSNIVFPVTDAIGDAYAKGLAYYKGFVNSLFGSGEQPKR